MSSCILNEIGYSYFSEICWQFIRAACKNDNNLYSPLLRKKTQFQLVTLCFNGCVVQRLEKIIDRHNLRAVFL